MPRRPTQSDIAQKAGLSRPTVSLALNGSSSVSEKTRAYVREIAESLGYKPDPLLSALSKYRKQDSKQHYQGALAWISHTGSRDPWNRNTTYKAYYTGAADRAESLGFKIEVIDTLQDNLNAKRLRSILNARGIQGILLCPPAKQDEVLELPYDDFSLVTFGYTIRTPNIHRVSSSHFRATRTVFNRLYDSGYRRIGFVGSKVVNEKTQDHCRSAYLGSCSRHQTEPVPELLTDPITTGVFEEWYDLHQPEAVIITSPLWPAIKKSKIKIPQELAVASPMVPLGVTELSGVIEKSQQIGAAAVDTLIQLILHDVRGIPTDPRNILLEGAWNQGTTFIDKQV